MIKVSIYGGKTVKMKSLSHGSTGTVANLYLVPYSHFFLFFLLSFKCSVGFKTKVDETNQIIVQQLVAGKNEEYRSNVEIMKISDEYEARMVSLKVVLKKFYCFIPINHS